MSRLVRILAIPGLVAVLWTAALAPEALAARQEAPTTVPPDTVGAHFLRSVRAIRWRATGELMDPETLTRFRTTVGQIVEPDTTGALREYLVQTDDTGMGALDDSEVFARAIAAVIEDLPGLMHALHDRDDDVLGHVAEGPTTRDPAQHALAHVVYRTTARLSGAVPEVKVMQLRWSAAGWRVLWSDELEVLEAALRGVGR